MTNIKFILIPVIALTLLATSTSFVFAKEKDSKENKGKNPIEKVVKVLAQTVGATTTPVTATSTSTTSTTTPPTSTTTPVIVATTTPPTTATTTATTTHAKTSTTTPIAETINKKVNDILANGFLASNYYGSTAFGSGMTKALQFAGGAAAVIGLGLLVSASFTSKRIISN